MTTMARILSVLPFTVNVSGRKKNLLCKAGSLFYPRLPASITYKEIRILMHGHSEASIVAFATHNFFKDFTQSDLGLFMKTHLHQGSVFADIGANLGGYSFLARRLGATVFGFEPYVPLFRFLKDNPDAFGHISPCALSDTETVASFFVSKSNIGGSSLVASSASWEASGYDHTEHVPVTTFDAFFSDAIAEGTVFDLVKVDVEGNEEKTVRGMQNALTRNQIKALWCEVRGPHSDRNAGSYKPVCRMMEEHGYRAYGSMKTKEPFDWKTADEKILPQFFDLLFERPWHFPA